MATQPCDGCGRGIRIAGGIANLWTLEKEPTEGMTLEFEDGSEHFLCFDCIEALPDFPDEGDVEMLDEER